MTNTKSKVSAIDIGVISVGMILIVLVIILAVGDNSTSENFDALSAQIKELSEAENTEGGFGSVESNSYTGVLEAATVQATEYKVSHYVVVGGYQLVVPESEYLTAKSNIGKLVTVEIERKKIRSADGEYSRTYNAVVIYEE